MTTSLLVGNVYAVHTAGATPAVIVGASNQWSDGSDLTYATTYFDTVNGGDYVAAPVTSAGSVGTLVSVGVTVRLQFDSANVGALDRTAYLHLYAGTNDLGAIPVTLPSLGSIGTFTGTVTSGDLNTPPYHFSDFQAAINSSTASVQILMGSPALIGSQNKVTVYEVALNYPDAGPAPACRKFPREDGQGVGSARHFPAPRSLQASPRRAGGYY